MGRGIRYGGVCGMTTNARAVAVIKTTTITLLVTALSGCVLAPDSLRPEVEHMSHVSQHVPFVSRANATGYGVATVELLAHWDIAKTSGGAGGYLEIGEGMALNRKWDCGCGVIGYGEIEGPREQFMARAGWVIPLK